MMMMVIATMTMVMAMIIWGGWIFLGLIIYFLEGRGCFLGLFFWDWFLGYFFFLVIFCD